MACGLAITTTGVFIFLMIGCMTSLIRLFIRFRVTALRATLALTITVSLSRLREDVPDFMIKKDMGWRFFGSRADQTVSRFLPFTRRRFITLRPWGVR